MFSKKNTSQKSEQKEGSEKLVKVKIVLPPAGRFRISASVGDEVEYPKPFALELIEAKYAEKI
jgi:hypothetical protein